MPCARLPLSASLGGTLGGPRGPSSLCRWVRSDLQPRAQLSEQHLLEGLVSSPGAHGGRSVCTPVRWGERLRGRGLGGARAEDPSEGASTANSSAHPHLPPPGPLDELCIGINVQKPHPRVSGSSGSLGPRPLPAASPGVCAAGGWRLGPCPSHSRTSRTTRPRGPPKPSSTGPGGTHGATVGRRCRASCAR